MQEAERCRLADRAADHPVQLVGVPALARRHGLLDPLAEVDERDGARCARPVLPERRVVVGRAERRAIAVAPRLGLVRIRRGGEVDHHEAVAAAPDAGPVDAVEVARIGIGSIDLPDVVLVLGLEVPAGSRRVPGVEHEDGVAGVLAGALAARGEVEAEQRRIVGRDPVLGLLAVDEPDSRVRRHDIGGAAIDPARGVVALEVLPVPRLCELARGAVRLHRREEAVGEGVRGVDDLALPPVLVRDEERLLVEVVVAPVVDERLGAEEREGVAARVRATRDQDARALEVGDLADERRLVQLARLEADHDHPERHLDARLRRGRVVRPLDRVRVGRPPASSCEAERGRARVRSAREDVPGQHADGVRAAGGVCEHDGLAAALGGRARDARSRGVVDVEVVVVRGARRRDRDLDVEAAARRLDRQAVAVAGGIEVEAEPDRVRVRRRKRPTGPGRRRGGTGDGAARRRGRVGRRKDEDSQPGEGGQQASAHG
jgi:hypothetical protein